MHPVTLSSKDLQLPAKAMHFIKIQEKLYPPNKNFLSVGCRSPVQCCLIRMKKNLTVAVQQSLRNGLKHSGSARPLGIRTRTRRHESRKSIRHFHSSRPDSADKSGGMARTISPKPVDIVGVLDYQQFPTGHPFQEIFLSLMRHFACSNVVLLRARSFRLSVGCS